MTTRKTIVDYGDGAMPEWVREVIETSLAIEAEDARTSGNLGFMTRALVSATMPYKDPKSKAFERRNGNLTLSMLSPHGVPYGRYPRLLVSWIVTEAVRTKSPVLVLGDSLAKFLRESVGVRATGGSEGSQTRLTEQMKRLFTSFVTVERQAADAGAGFVLDSVLLVQRARLSDADARRLDRLDAIDAAPNGGMASRAKLWEQKAEGREIRWNSELELTAEFFKECTQSPVPLDMRAYRILSPAPMAMDIYAWLTYRASYIKQPTRPVPWSALQAQFGSGHAFTDQGLRDFRKAFKRNLDVVREVYRDLRVDETSEASGLILLPMKPHVQRPSAPKQTDLF